MMRDLFDTNGHSFGLNDDDAVQKVKLCDFEMVLHYETPDAFRLSDTGDDNRAEWYPKRLVDLHRGSKQCSSVKKDGQRVVLPVVTVKIPEWLAREKGLV